MDNNFLGKPFLPYWAIVLGALIYVASRNAEQQPIQKRFVKLLISGLLGIGGGEASPDLFGGAAVTTGVLIVCSVAALDVALPLISDPKIWRRLINAKIGNGDRDA